MPISQLNGSILMSLFLWPFVFSEELFLTVFNPWESFPNLVNFNKCQLKVHWQIRGAINKDQWKTTHEYSVVLRGISWYHHIEKW